MDTLLSTLSASLLDFVEDLLSNDENSTDDELLGHFIANGLTEEQARQALTYRDRYLRNIYKTGFTPIRHPGVVLRYDLDTRDVEPE